MLLMPLAGFTLTFCIFPGNLPVVVKSQASLRRHCIQNLTYMGYFFSPPQIVGRISASDVDQQRQGKAKLSASRFRSSSITTTCLPTLVDCTGTNYIKWGDGMCWDCLCTALPANLLWSTVPQYRPREDSGVITRGDSTSCAWNSNPFSQSNTQTVITLSQKEVMLTLNYTQRCWPVPLNISNNEAILKSPALSSFPFLKN